MSAATLRFIPSQAKTQIAPAKYEVLTGAVSRFLSYTLSLPNAKLDIPWARGFICAYAEDAARHALLTLDDDEESSEAGLSTQERAIRKFVLQMAGRLAEVQDGLNVSVLVDLSIVYGKGHTISMRTLFSKSIKSTPALLKEFRTDVLPSFAAVLNTPDRLSTYVLSQLVYCCPEVALLFAEDQTFLLELAKSYQTGLDSIAAARGGMVIDPSQSVEPWQKGWLYTKTGLIDVFSGVIQTLLQSPLSRHTDRLFEILSAILNLPSSSVTPKTHFVSQSLLADYQYAFDLSSILGEKFRGVDDSRVGILQVSLSELAPSLPSPKPAGVLSIIQGPKPSRNVTPLPAVDHKGKARAVEQEMTDEEEVDLAVSQVLDIFPDESPQHIRRCLNHQSFNGDAEKLITALLEGTLPQDLAYDDTAQKIPQEEEFEFTKNRRNVWDDVEMDFSRLRIGKIRGDADELLQDRSWIEQMKADIIRRIEELSSDEEGEQGYRMGTFEDELDDDAQFPLDKPVKVVGDGEESDGADDGGYSSDHAVNSPETVLELAYMEDPKLFDRDAATRRSKARSDLKEKTGLGDEQIEGWRIMLERNPKKDRILQKHGFTGNAPLLQDANNLEPGPSGSSRGGVPHRGRGGGGRGRGYSKVQGESGADTAHSRAWKDKNKARQGNHNRKRGHDKKMARGGGSVPM